MKPANSQIPLGKFAWVVLVVVAAAPLLFFALVTPEENPAAESPKIELPPSKLAAVGLRENRDWDGIAEMFEIWADRVDWVDGKTVFAFWNPASRSYSYYFEASRSNGQLRLKEISARDAAPPWVFPSFFEEDGLSHSHPFLFAMGNGLRSGPWPESFDGKKFSRDVAPSPVRIELEGASSRKP